MEIATTHRRQHRGGRILVNLACALVMLLAVGFIVPAALGFQRYVITGSSMGGSLGVGPIAFEEVVPVNDLRVGDVITYQPPADSGIDHLVTHRIVSIQGDVYRTQGDANAGRRPVDLPAHLDLAVAGLLLRAVRRLRLHRPPGPRPPDGPHRPPRERRSP